MATDSQLDLWEVFIQGRNGSHHTHAGSVHASDKKMALQNARDIYTRRGEGSSIWVVPAVAISASNPEDAEAFFDPADDKVYRHPTFLSNAGRCKTDLIMTDINQLKYSYSLRLGDNAWILSHRLAEWCSNGPILEEDLALTNLALDLIGRAQGFYKYAAELEGKGKSEDDIAYRRNERQYFNNLIMEMPNGNFADTIARQLYVSVFEYYFFRELKNSKDETFAALAAKTLKEVKYHMAHAADWTIRLGDGTEESHKKMQKALNELWMYTGELFEMNDVDSELMAQGVSVDLSMLKPKWEQHIIDVLKEATLAQPEDIYMQTGSRQGIHTEHLGHILGDMQYLQRAYPDAKW